MKYRYSRSNPPEAPQVSIEERLCAAAHTILTDGLPHRHDAQLWAVRFLRARANTAFTRAASRRVLNDRPATPRRGPNVPTRN